MKVMQYEPDDAARADTELDRPIFLPDGRELTDELAAEVGQTAIDEAAYRKR
jgi:hypothetical protein